MPLIENGTVKEHRMQVGMQRHVARAASMEMYHERSCAARACSDALLGEMILSTDLS